MLATWHFHIEISSKCTLRCPRCARQEVPNTLINTELDLDFFQRNFTADFIEQHLEKITFCGDDGDPIYAHDLIPVIRYIKSVKPVEFVIITNGSYKKPQWWSELGSLLDHNDSVHFSIDGWDHHSNQQYRVNSDFDSILDGIQTLRSVTHCEIVWAAIAFRFNQNQISHMQHMAKTLGMDRFQLTKSTKFGSVYPAYGAGDNLEPDREFVSSSHRFERTITQLHPSVKTAARINAKILSSQVAEYHGVKPLCEIGNKGLYIDARGRLFPCCWVANRYSHNSDWRRIAERFDLNQRTLQDALSDTFWETQFRDFPWQECKTKCSAHLVQGNYATEW
jgi:MoaA/NifB/PqqE/SkfB family radical SAM enzyme